MNDIQLERPEHEIPINQVGVRNLSYPIRVLDKTNEFQNTIADVTMLVDLPKQYRGTHMSRFIEILNKYKGEFAYKEVRPLLEELKVIFDAQCAHLSLSFPYFIEKAAPVSGAKSFLEYTAFFNSTLNDVFHFELGVKVPVSILCPCSKEISDFGAHNQRAEITIVIEFSDFVWIEELVEIAESSASSPLYTLLKRTDEKFVTEHAYDNPCFVEDVVRRVAQKLLDDSRIKKFRVETISFESIHNHNAFALLEMTK